MPYEDVIITFVVGIIIDSKMNHEENADFIEKKLVKWCLLGRIRKNFPKKTKFADL